MKRNVVLNAGLQSYLSDSGLTVKYKFNAQSGQTDTKTTLGSSSLANFWDETTMYCCKPQCLTWFTAFSSSLAFIGYIEVRERALPLVLLSFLHL